MEIRKVYAPYSKTGEQVGQTPVEGYIDVKQVISPVLQTGLVNENGEWVGLKSSDKDFIAYAKDEAIPNGGEILAPQILTGSIWPLDMTGFNDLQIAIKPTNTGNYAITAIMGPDSSAYANLNPVNPASTLVGIPENRDVNQFQELFADTAQALTQNVWNIFMIQTVLKNQKLLQFKIVNNSGGESDIETTFMRVA